MCRRFRVLVKSTAFPRPEASTRRGRATAANCSISEAERRHSRGKCSPPTSRRPATSNTAFHASCSKDRTSTRFRSGVTT